MGKLLRLLAEKFSFAFIIISILLILLLTFAVKLETLSTFQGEMNDGHLLINADFDSHSDFVYVFADKADIKKIKADDIVKKVGSSLIYFDEAQAELLQGLPYELSVSVVTGEESLAHRMFIKAGKSN